MDKKIMFLRHYQMEFPYDSWKNLNLQQWVDLTTHKADPDIKQDVSMFLQNNFSPKSFDNIDIIFTSEYLRTFKTAEALCKFLNIKVPIIKYKILNEIPSKVLEVPSIKGFNEMKTLNKLEVKTKRIYRKLQTLRIINDIDTLLVNIPQHNILVISHSYIIGQLNYWFNYIHRINKNYNFKASQKYEIGGYLRGFTTNIKQ